MLDYLEKIVLGTDLQDVWRQHCAAMKGFGFDRLIYGYTQYKTENSIGPVEDALILSNHHPDYLRRFVNDGLYKDAPLTAWAVENNGSGERSWSWLRDHADALTNKQRKVVEYNRTMGVIAGYTLTFAGASSRARAAIGLAAQAGMSHGDVDNLWLENGRQISLMNSVFHLKVVSLPHEYDRPKLSERQLEALEWVGDGKTNQDIADILGVSVATVEKHLRLAREKLGVETTAHAVLKASFQNQMFLL